MIEAFDIATLCISILLILKNFKKTLSSSRYIIYSLFVFFYVLPLLLDCIFGIPEYPGTYYYGFRVSSQDHLTRIVYDICLIFSQLVILKWNTSWIRFSHIGNVDDSSYAKGYDAVTYENDLMYLVLWVGALLPILLTLVMPVSKGVLFTFQWREYGIFTVGKYLSFIEKFTYIGVCCSVLLLFSDRNKNIMLKIFIILILFSDICIQGKRSIIFFAMLMYILIKLPGLRDTKISFAEKKKKIIGIGIVVLLVIAFMVAMTYTVKITTRGYDVNDVAKLYTSLRVDFLRDDRVRMAIYSFLYPDKMTILETFGQTIFPIITWTFPLDHILADFDIVYKSFSTYMSTALEGSSVLISAAYMTPAIFAELICNFGIIGMLIMPFLCVWFSKKADDYPYPFNVLIIAAFIFLQMYEITYTCYFFEFVVIMCLIAKAKTRVIIKVGSNR